jgi:transposase, IS30 family
MKHYTQLTEPERNQIYALKQAGFKPSAIALQLSRHPSTICRELRRNHGLRGYRPRQAQQMADTRRREKAKPKIPEATYDIVNDLIEKDWSPEQISGWLAAEKNVRISHERIYQHIARDRKRGGGEVCIFTCAAGKKEKGSGETASDELV